LLEDLGRDDEETRVTTIFNLSDQLPPLAEALPVVRKALHDQGDRVRDRALTAAVRLIHRTEEHLLIETCESLLLRDPSDMAALAVLLHFYVTAHYRSDAYRKSRHKLVFRVIEDIPDAHRFLAVPMKLFPGEDGDAFEQAKTLWLKQVEKHPENTRVLDNAAAFFRCVDDVIAGKLLRRCKELEPENPKWSKELGCLYSHQGDPKQPESYKDWALMSLAELEAAWNADDGKHRQFLALLQLPEVALKANNLEKARHYAEKLLAAAPDQEHPFSQIWGDRQGRMVLGWLALYRNDFAEARACLFSARTPTDSYLGSSFCFMDPLMQLVGWMLYRGQRKAVLAYFRRERELVPAFRERLDRWSVEIEKGKTPDFQDRELLGENLRVVNNASLTGLNRSV